MFNKEVKVDGKYVRGTIKKASKPKQESVQRQHSYRDRTDLADSPIISYVFHGTVQKHTGEGQGTWSIQDLMECSEEMEKLRYQMDLMNKEDSVI